MNGRDCAKCQKSREGTQGIMIMFNEEKTKLGIVIFSK